MGYGDNRQGGDRWRGGRDDDWRGERGDNRRGGEHRREGAGRGFFDRAGEQVRSWLGDDDDRHRRGGGGRGSDRDHGREQSWRGGGDESWGRDHGWGPSERWSGGDSFGGGWGNQAPRAGSDENRGSSGGSDDRSRDRDQGGGWNLFGGGGSQGRSRHDDPHYSEWRQRQIDQLDRDYDDYRRENQSRFHQEFTGWREKRQGQRQAMGRVTEQMEVIGSDGQHVGKVDKVSGERIILAKNDPKAGGIHHSVPCSWIERVDEQVHVNRTAEQAMREWQDEERSRALFERENSGSPGPHMLNRSFSGTYSDRDER